MARKRNPSKHTKTYLKKRAIKERFEKTGRGEYIWIKPYSYTRNGKVIHVKGHFAHKPEK